MLKCLLPAATIKPQQYKESDVMPNFGVSSNGKLCYEDEFQQIELEGLQPTEIERIDADWVLVKNIGYIIGKRTEKTEPKQ